MFFSGFKNTVHQPFWCSKHQRMTLQKIARFHTKALSCFEAQVSYFSLPLACGCKPLGLLLSGKREPQQYLPGVTLLKVSKQIVVTPWKAKSWSRAPIHLRSIGSAAAQGVTGLTPSLLLQSRHRPCEKCMETMFRKHIS